MNIKLIFIGLFVLALNACDSNESTTEQPTSSQHTDVATAQAPSAVVELPAAESVQPQQVVAAVAQPRSGESIYKTSCSSCHATGAAKAPKLGDKAAWKPRIDKGMNVLLQSAINGVPGTAMMKRGTCGSCSDDEMKAVVDYMVSQSK